MLALCSFVCCATVNADAGDTITKGDFAYSKETNKIVAYIGESGICEIPENSEVNGLYRSSLSSAPIEKLVINKGVNWDMILSGELQKFSSLNEVIFKEGVTEIPYQAFESCKALEKITIPSTVTQIGDYAVSNCPSLKTIEFPDGVKSIGEYAFSNLTSLSGDVILPNSLTQMGEGVFSNCGNLEKVHLSDNLTYTPKKNYNGSENYANWFEHTKVGEINIPDSMLDNPTCQFHADEITFNSDMTVDIYKAVKDSSWCHNKYLKGKTDKNMGGYDGFAIAENTVLRYIGDDKNPVVPDGVKAIGDRAFTYCDIDKVTLPQSLQSIGNSAFYLSTLKDIVIPSEVKNIGEGAFDYCPLLAKMTFEGNPELGSNAVIITDILTKDNIIVKGSYSELKEKIISGGSAESYLPTFYKLFNNGRKEFGLKEIDVQEETTNPTKKPEETAKSTQKPEVTEKPQATAEPAETPAPTVIPEKLYVQNGDIITVKVDKQMVLFPDAQPFIDDNGRTQVPVRAVSEILDCKVDWNGDAKTATVTRENGDIIKLTLDSDIMTVNDKPVQMDTSAIIKDDRTYIPVRFVAEALGLNVEWVQ